MSIFSETMKKAISVYRTMLRKYLPQPERISKLHELNLKNPQLYNNEIALYHTGYAIISDIGKNLDPEVSGYYAYSGVTSFGDYLREFLSNYEIEGNAVIHRSQRASRALIRAIQLLTLPEEKLSQDVANELAKCNNVIANYGSDEQKELHKTTLQTTIHRQHEQNSFFYRNVLNNFQQKVREAKTAE